MKHIRSHSPFQPSLPPAREQQGSWGTPRAPKPRSSVIVQSGRHVGRVVTWKPEKQNGFIRPENGEQDVFFHGHQAEASGLTVSLGDRLEYSLQLGSNGQVSACEFKVMS